jgi:hypothetical protein
MKPARPHAPGKIDGAAPSRWRLAGTAAAVLAAGVLTLIGICGKCAPLAAPDYSVLPGRWLRPDGGYVVDIRSVAADGRMDVSYYNPAPIHVARAQASRAGDTLKVVVELRDVNYPGSTYTLAYDPSEDRLKGAYYQAVAGETFEVFFTRMKP